MLNWLSRTENIALIVSIISLLISLAMPVIQFLNSREKYRISVVDYRSPTDISAQLLVCIENLSDSPLTIISIFLDGVCCALDARTLRDMDYSRRAERIIKFPVCIPAHGAQYCYLEFFDEALQGILLFPGKELTLQIHSTFRQEYKSTILGNRLYYLHND